MADTGDVTDIFADMSNADATGYFQFRVFKDGFDDLAINWVCWKLYARIEQGTEGNKTDTSYYSNLYLGMLEELRLSIPQGVSMPSPPVSIPERW